MLYYAIALDMKIALIGYGRMGKIVEKLIEDSGEHEIVLIVDPLLPTGKLESGMLTEADVAIDFSSSSAVLDNLEIYAETGCPTVIGTTGWDKSVLSQIEGKTKIIYSGNFSIGVAIYLQIVSNAARLIDVFDQYDVAVVESHHTGKADHPSGTALMIASRLIDAIDRKKRIVTGCPDGRIAEDVIEISSVRVGSEPGTHTLIMDGGADTIEITHKARSREGFASGAIMAAEWIVNRNNGIYTLDDFIQDISGGRI